MTEQERNLDLLIADLEQENRLLRARNERLEREATTIKDFKHRLAAAIDAMPFGDTAASFAVYIRDFK
jgi:cell division protein FtsB